MYTLERLLIVRKVEKELQYQKKRYLKGPIEIIQRLVDLKKIEMEFIQESSLKANDMGKENLYGIMDSHSKENGEMVKKMGLDCGDRLAEIIMKVNGKITGKMVKDSMFISGAQNIKVNSKISLSMVKVMKSSQTEIDTQVNINSVNLTGREDIYGQMEIIMKASSLMGLERGEES